MNWPEAFTYVGILLVFSGVVHLLMYLGYKYLRQGVDIPEQKPLWRMGPDDESD